MASAAYRDPLESAVARVGQLEREKAELLALTRGARKARFRTRAGVALAFAVMLVTAPAIAWVVRGNMPPVMETRTYEGKYMLHTWTTPTATTASGPLHVTVDPKTGKLQGVATGPIGSVRVAGQVNGAQVDVIAYAPERDASGTGSGRIAGDVMTGGFGVPKMAASATFVIETIKER